MIPNTITITFDREAGVVLLESLSWSAQATERTLQGNPNNERAHDKWDVIEELIAQIQDAKRGWYGTTNDAVTVTA
jgi:hypothetical protein